MTERAGAWPDGYRLITLETASSTNQVALDNIRTGDARDGDVIFTEHQTSGRGRLGRSWESPNGNLFMSLILRVEGHIEVAAQLSFVAAVATRDAIASFSPTGAKSKVTCKWPNDVLIDGRKACGILLETEKHAFDPANWVVVGIGVNLAQPPAESRFPATCLKDVMDLTILPSAMLSAIMNAFSRWRARWDHDGFTPVRDHWLSTAHALGDEIAVRNGTKDVSGIFAGIEDGGALILRTAQGDLAINAGDVHFPGADT